MKNTERFNQAISRIDEANARDPNQDIVDGTSHPRELLYAQRLSEWVIRLAPDASEELRLAARCQHICRWEIPRNDYEMNRPGYLKWRSDLKKFHAETAGKILREVGYPEETITRVQELNLKKQFPRDPETCVLEDALCLMFLQHQFADLARRTSEEKVINALRKSWKKMTPAAHDHALKLPYSESQKSLLDQALK